LKQQQRDLALLAIAAALLFFVTLGARDLWAPNEPSYGQVVVEMLDSGDWLLPTLNGEVFAEKPVLSYWLGALVSTLAGGVSEFTLRTPVALAGVGSVLLVYLLIGFYAGRRAALIGSAVFATEYLVWWTARTVQMDSFVLLSTLATTFALTRRLDGDWSARKAWIVAGLSAGLGFAAKGPVTSVVPAAILLAYCLVARRPLFRLFKGLPWGLAVFALSGLPWYAALWASGQTEALHELILRQNFSRFVEAWDHRQPWYYFVKYFWVSYAPWSWLVPVAAFIRPLSEPIRRAKILGWMWILAPLLFFSLADSKREPYMLPVAPGIALLVALVLDRLASGELTRRQRAACLVVCGLFGVLFLGLAAYLWLAPPAEAPPELSLALMGGSLLICAALVLGGLIAPTRQWSGPAGLCASMVLLFVVASVHVLPAGNSVKSHRAFAYEVRDLLADGDRLYGFFGPGTRKWIRGGGYAFYMGRTIPHLEDEGLLTAWSEPEPICFISEVPLGRAKVPSLPRAHRVLTRGAGKKSVLICREPEPAPPSDMGADLEPAPADSGATAQ